MVLKIEPFWRILILGKLNRVILIKMDIWRTSEYSREMNNRTNILLSTSNTRRELEKMHEYLFTLPDGIFVRYLLSDEILPDICVSRATIWIINSAGAVQLNAILNEPGVAQITVRKTRAFVCVVLRTIDISAKNGIFISDDNIHIGGEDYEKMIKTKRNEIDEGVYKFQYSFVTGIPKMPAKMTSLSDVVIFFMRSNAPFRSARAHKK